MRRWRQRPEPGFYEPQKVKGRTKRFFLRPSRRDQPYPQLDFWPSGLSCSFERARFPCCKPLGLQTFVYIVWWAKLMNTKHPDQSLWLASENKNPKGALASSSRRDQEMRMGSVTEPKIKKNWKGLRDHLASPYTLHSEDTDMIYLSPSFLFCMWSALLQGLPSGWHPEWFSWVPQGGEFLTSKIETTKLIYSSVFLEHLPLMS